MVKVLARAGVTLADIYDVEGSVAGVEQLIPEEVALVHEMGATIFSERLGGGIRRVQTAGIAQSTNFDSTFLDLPAGAWRLLGVLVFAGNAGRTANVQISLRAEANDREIPVLVWDSAADAERSIRLIDDGGAVSDFTALLPSNGSQIPNLGVGTGQPQTIGTEVVFRGTTSAFGAGTVSLRAILYVAGSQQPGSGIASIGLPLPGW